MKFLGIDLGWQSGASGLCCLDWQQGTLVLADLQCQTAIANVLSWVDQWTAGQSSAVIAVDAPLLIPNETGMRLPDRLAHKYFGKYDAGCYPANRGRPFAQRLIDFGLALEARGFQHSPYNTAQPTGRFQLEVFPHPAIVHLFGLSRILKYKKGRLADRQVELLKLRQYQLTILPTLEPPLLLTAAELPDIPTRGVALKAVEDQLDSLMCAYVAAHWWFWGCDRIPTEATHPIDPSIRNWVLGDQQEGYIVVPAPQPSSPAS
ncbi:MAG TPA: DUF429 domain-containing protein [Leptolyngbyaceae cyanobacterium]